MRGILFGIVVSFFFGITALLLWLREKKRVDKLSGELDTYYSYANERRRAVRLNKKLNVTCSVVEKSGSKWSVFSKDISGEGICLYLPEILPQDALVQLDIALNDKRHITAQGEVAWVKEETEVKDDVGKRQFSAGIKLTKVNPKDKQRLKDYIEESLKS